MDIDGNVALVTGGASGLGEATVRHLHGGGAPVVVFDRDPNGATPSSPSSARGRRDRRGDATSLRTTRRRLRRRPAAELGPLRILVACAGGVAAERAHRDATTAPPQPRLFRATVDLNLVATFNSRPPRRGRDGRPTARGRRRRASAA